MEVRSVRSMLEEVLSNWERYSATVGSLQAWLEDAEEALGRPDDRKRVRRRRLAPQGGSFWHRLSFHSHNIIITTSESYHPNAHPPSFRRLEF